MTQRPWLQAVLLGLGLAVLAGCGRPPVGLQQAVSPCIELPKAAGFDGRVALMGMLEADFKLKDADKDDIVTLAEAQARPERPNLITETVFRHFKIRDGKLSFEDLKNRAPEFYGWADHYKGQLLERYDRNKDRSIGLEEVKGLFGIDETDYKTADTVKADTPGNGDGKLDADEFLGLVLARNAAEPGCSPAAAASLRKPGTTRF
jgi:hypothetical protein